MFHTIIIAGHLGRDPEMRYTTTGHPVTTFSVASNRRWTDQDGQPQEETIWFRVSAFGKLAETCNQFLAKGQPVLVEGRLRPDESGNPRTWIGQDGTPRASFEVIASTVRFLGRREGVAGETSEPAGDEAIDAPVADTEADIDPLVEMAAQELGATVREAPAVPEPVFPADVMMKDGTFIQAGTPISQIGIDLARRIAQYWQSTGKYPDFVTAVLGQ